MAFTPSMAKPRIVYLIGQLRLGGYERQLYNLLRVLDRQRYRPAVVVWNAAEASAFSSRIEALGVPLFLLPEARNKPAKLMTLRRLIRSLAPEIVHSYSFYTNFPAWWSTLGTGMIAVGSIRNNFVSERRQAGTLLGRLSARWPALQICNSSAAKIAVERTTGPFKPSKLNMVPNGLDVDAFFGSSDFPATPTLLAVGRLYSEKRWDRLVAALADLQDKGLSCRARHAGKGPLLSSLQAQAARLGVDHLIEFLGERQDVPRLLAESTALVHTADDEGCPNVVMEAMASARPVVATDAGHCPSLIEHGRTGFVVRRGDHSGLVTCIETLVRDRDLALRMGGAGRAKAEREFGLDQLVQRTVHAYAEAGWHA